MSYIILVDGVAVGPFETHNAASNYKNTDWQGGTMRIIELYPPDSEVNQEVA